MLKLEATARERSFFTGEKTKTKNIYVYIYTHTRIYRALSEGGGGEMYAKHVSGKEKEKGKREKETILP